MAVVTEVRLTLPQVAEVAEVEYRTLHKWVKRGLLEPSFHASTGAGSPNLFSFQDALKARILGDLRAEGIDLELVDRTAKELLAHPWLEPDDTLLVNGRLLVLKSGDDINAAIDKAKPSVIYRVAWAVDVIEPALEKFRI